MSDERESRAEVPPYSILVKALMKIRDNFECTLDYANNQDERELENWNLCQHCIADLALQDFEMNLEPVP